MKRVTRKVMVLIRFFGLACFWVSFANGLLSPKGVNFEVQALMAIKSSLRDPHGIMNDWDATAVDPCCWNMITCSADNLVVNLLMQNNNISRPIPAEIGRLPKLQKLDLSSNMFSGAMPSSISQLKSLQYLWALESRLPRSHRDNCESLF